MNFLWVRISKLAFHSVTAIFGEMGFGELGVGQLGGHHRKAGITRTAQLVERYQLLPDPIDGILYFS
jgi:hypothetical protein